MQNKKPDTISATEIYLASKAMEARKPHLKRIGLFKRCFYAIRRVVSKHFYGEVK